MCNHPCHHGGTPARPPSRPMSRPTRRQMLKRAAALAAALSLGPGLSPARADAPTLDLPPPGPGDTCPVCGMFVYKYPEWVTTVLYADGYADHFDGAKDYFKYMFDMEKYALGRKADQITGMGVTEYYGLKLIDAREALYVVGSDVLGPMGHELVPLMNAVDAQDFMRDHKGQKLLRHDEVTPELIDALDQGGPF
ncbi:nitrous oxide reductase accessory protein NosL [Thioclava sp. DLFJ4-1]|uniref:nitrous oxide reductase accessory protein NosL n=1 Tax=Thioclava sp. DLFJ4-1 TaxID=1915313 RepID=UPI001FF07449|nr:nitrous oxide reductase accessory protein NosL [Thioclava sp. DLFJ4-1]